MPRAIRRVKNVLEVCMDRKHCKVILCVLLALVVPSKQQFKTGKLGTLL